MDPLKTQPQQQESKLHFLDYWRIIRIRKTVILAVFFLVFITATLVTYILPKSYASTARIMVEGDSSDIPEMSTGMPIARGFDPYFIQTQFELIQSELILGKVVTLMNLNAEWGKKYAGGVPLKTTETIEIMKKRMDLKPVRNTKFIEIKVYSEDPKEAASIANQIATAYKDYRSEELRQRTEAGIKVLEERFEEQESKVRKVHAELNELRKNLKISDVDAQGTAPQPYLEVETLRRFEGLRIESENFAILRENMLNQIRPLSVEELRQVLPTIVPDSTLTDLLNQLNTAEQRLVVMQQEYAADHPTFIQAKDLVIKINGQINDRVNGIMKGLESDASSARKRADHLKQTVEEAKKADQEKAETSRPYYEKKRELESLLKFSQILTLKLEAQRLDVNLPKTMVVLTDPATVSDEPVRPRVFLNITLGVVVGLIVGIGLAFFIEYLDTSVKTIDDVERSLQSPVLGVIPQDIGSLLEEGGEGAHAEAYRVLRTNLLFSRKDEKLNSVAVVSAGAGEGKSTTVFNLAAIFAQSGQRVIIVDSDLRRPTLHKRFGVANTIGLTNYLLKQNTLEEVIQTTNLPTLDFMASGKLPSSSLGILSSNQMKELITDLKRRYDFVFFDSPPIMGVSDASILASEVDMTIQVIQYRRYPQPMNIRAKQLIEKVGGNLIGIVLNNINMSQDESYYYYSGYYHDYYSKNEEMEEASPAENGAAAADSSRPKVEIKQKY
ncbi:MAG TPA: polysaccharide biosynthesis tyrosine autokinase [Verrucomicrobiota bacterium]|nr:polysaccharide biosynthesis tyrosine autokinase [Verrucomicrobiota bacterium]